MRDFLNWAPWLLKKFNYNIKGMEKISKHCVQVIAVLIASLLFFLIVVSDCNALLSHFSECVTLLLCLSVTLITPGLYYGTQ